MSLRRYQKKAVVAAASFANGTSSIPARHVGPSVVPTKVGALIAKWPGKLPAPKITTGVDGTMTIPAAAFASTASKAVEVMKSFGGGEQLLHADTDPNTSAVVYEVTVDEAGTRCAIPCRPFIVQQGSELTFCVLDRPLSRDGTA